MRNQRCDRKPNKEVGHANKEDAKRRDIATYIICADDQKIRPEEDPRTKRRQRWDDREDKGNRVPVGTVEVVRMYENG